MQTDCCWSGAGGISLCTFELKTSKIGCTLVLHFIKRHIFEKQCAMSLTGTHIVLAPVLIPGQCVQLRRTVPVSCVR